MTKPKETVVMALYPSSKGMGFSIFQGPKKLVDWGYSDFRCNKANRTLKKIESLIHMYQPEIAILEDKHQSQPKRCFYAKDLTTTITEYLIKKDIPVKHYATQDVSQAFPALNKDARAKQIATVLPELEDYLPPKRKTWVREHRRMQIFDAAALALTYFYQENY